MRTDRRTERENVMRRKRRDWISGKAPEANAAWLLTFADLCTLLLTFFVLLLSMSTLNKHAFKTTFGQTAGLTGQTSAQSTRSTTAVASTPVELNADEDEAGLLLAFRSETTRQDSDSAEESRGEIQDQKALMKERRSQDRFSFVLAENLLFHDEGLDINPEAYPVLEAMGAFLKDSKYRAYIEGHAGSPPVNGSGFASPSEYSAAQSAAVLSFLLSRCGVSPEQLALGRSVGSPSGARGGRDSAAQTSRRVEIIFEKQS